MVRSDFVPNSNQWYHVVSTYDGQTHSLYIDGTLNAAAAHSGAIDTSTLPLFVGRTHWPGNENYFDGSIERVALSNAALSASTVLARYQALNTVPATVSGGPYEVIQGASLTLDASGSSDAEGNIVSYEWDLDYDGQTFAPDLSSASAVQTTSDLGSIGTRDIALRVTDAFGESSIDVAQLTVLNAEPEN